jgi:hypothetical protein
MLTVNGVFQGIGSLSFTFGKYAPPLGQSLSNVSCRFPVLSMAAFPITGCRALECDIRGRFGLAVDDVGRPAMLLGPVTRMTFTRLGIPAGTHMSCLELKLGLCQTPQPPGPTLLELARGDRQDVTDGRQEP